MPVVTNNPFSVDKEYNDILHDHKATKSRFVILSDSENLKLKKSERVVHKVCIGSIDQINDLRKRLLDLEMQDGGIIIRSKRKPERYPSYLFIIDKGSVSHYANRVALPDL